MVSGNGAAGIPGVLTVKGVGCGGYPRATTNRQSTVKLLIYIVFLAATPPTWEYSPRELEEKRLLVEGWKKMATEPLPRKNLNEYINKLGLAVSAASSSKDKRGTERSEAYWLLRDRLLSIPGHAEYYRDRINRLRQIVDDYKAAKAENPEFVSAAGTGVSRLSTAQLSGFKTLENLPSVETVRVLGEFLSDDRGAEIPLMEQINTGEGPNGELAMIAISRLGIANAPTPPIRVSEDMDRRQEGWKQWYAEVKAGRRAFRFIGDPVDYDLRGPSKRGAVEPLEPRNLNRPGGGDGEASQGKAKEKASGTAFLPYAVATILVLAGLYFAFRNKKSHG